MDFKKYLFAGAALMTLTMFTACSDDDNNEQNPDPTPGGDTEITDPWATADVVTWPADTVVNLTDHFHRT